MAEDAGAGGGSGAGVAELGYEQARDALVEVVRRLEAGGVPLEESLALWERGEALAARCQSWLDGARERLEAVRSRPDDQRSRPDDQRSRPDGGDERSDPR